MQIYEGSKSQGVKQKLIFVKEKLILYHPPPYFHKFEP